MVIARHAFTDSRLHESRQRRQNVDRRINLTTTFNNNLIIITLNTHGYSNEQKILQYSLNYTIPGQLEPQMSVIQINEACICTGKMPFMFEINWLTHKRRYHYN